MNSMNRKKQKQKKNCIAHVACCSTYLWTITNALPYWASDVNMFHHFNAVVDSWEQYQKASLSGQCAPPNCKTCWGKLKVGVRSKSNWTTPECVRNYLNRYLQHAEPADKVKGFLYCKISGFCLQSGLYYTILLEQLVAACRSKEGNLWECPSESAKVPMSVWVAKKEPTFFMLWFISVYKSALSTFV